MWFAKFENRLVIVERQDAFYSLIRYNELGMEITEYVENSELEFLEFEEEEN